MRVFHVRLSNFVCPSFPFEIEGGMWNVVVLIPDHCLSIYFVEDFCAQVNKYSHIGEHKNNFCISGLDYPLTFNQRVSYFDSFKLSGWLK